MTVVDNASTDDTSRWPASWRRRLRGVAAMHLPRKGRGYALRAAWSTSAAPVVAYMDVDLSTSLPALLPLVAPLLSGHRDVAIGSRLARGAHVVRGPKRELISRAYNLLLKLTLRGHFSDAQCGFKALRRDAAEKLLPLVEDDEWFFDTELLVTAERLGPAHRRGSGGLGRRSRLSGEDRVDGCRRLARCVADAGAASQGPSPRAPQRGRGRPATALRRRWCGLDARLPLPLRRPGARSSGRSGPTPSPWRSPPCSTRRCTGSSPAPPTARPAGAASTPSQAGSYAVSFALTTLGLLVAQLMAPGALLPELVAITRGEPGRCRLPVRRAAGLDLPPRRPLGRPTLGGVTMTDLTPASDAAIGVLDPPGTTRRSCAARTRRQPRPHRPGRQGPGAGGWPASCAARRATRPGCVPPCSRCSPPPPSSICGTSAPAGGATPSIRPPCRRGPRAGRPSSSAPRTRPTSSPSTSRPRSCGRWRSRPASSGSTRGACWRRRPSRAWPPSAWSTCPSGAGSARRPRSSAAPWWRSRRWPP